MHREFFEPDDSSLTVAASPRVFISYSHDSREHEDEVLGLAARLRRDGIDADNRSVRSCAPGRLAAVDGP